MDFLTAIWTAWNEQWGTAIATILAVTAFLKSMGKEMKQLVSGVWRWNGWAITSKLYRNVIARYRERRAKSVMRRTLEEKRLRIGIRTYENCLREDQSKSTRNYLKEVTPANPSWLNDYYVATALEALSIEGSVVKAKGYSLQSLPTNPETYYFETVSAGKSACEETVRIETDNMCLVYHNFGRCQSASRFESHHVAETVSPRQTKFHRTFSLKDMAPPCDMCWEKEGRERDIRSLVDNITRYDLASLATADIIGANGEFQGAIADICIESQCPAEVSLIKSVVKKAIDIRQEQITRYASRSQHE